MKLGTVEIVKFKKLKMRLKIPQWQAVGVLESLWMFAARNAPLGDIGRHSNDDIAAAIEWNGDPDELVNTLVDCRWLDQSENHRILIHDWRDHMPDWLKGNLKKHGKELAVDQVAKQPAKQPTEQPAKQAIEQATEHGALLAASSLLFSSHSNSSHLTQGAETPTVEEKTDEQKPPDVTHGGTWRDETDEDFREMVKAIPVGKRAGEKAMWPIYQQARADIAHEHKTSETVAGLFLRERLRAYAASWHGMRGKFSWTVKTFLQERHDRDPPEAWEEPRDETKNKQSFKPAKSYRTHPVTGALIESNE